MMAPHEPDAIAPDIVLLMGVSGSGKTTIGQWLAEALGWPFLDADALHGAANLAKMQAGLALTDADRAGWLKAVRGAIESIRAAGQRAVIACSALKRSYRGELVGADDDIAIVFLHGSPDLIAERLGRRSRHFMPASLLASQFDTLEEPAPDERVTTIDIDAPPQEIVRRIIEKLRAGSA
jgi:carbohydrate kinase (thermoresistant glucokinase family)